MKFTKDKPTQRGWYWYYLESDAGDHLTIAKVDIEGIGLHATPFHAGPDTEDEPKMVKDLDGFWCPMPKPPLPARPQQAFPPVVKGPEGMKKPLRTCTPIRSNEKATENGPDPAAGTTFL